MTSSITQTGRWLTVTSPLGEDDLIPTDLTGHEEVSRPFRFDLHCLSPRLDLTPKDLLGKEVTVHVDAADAPRHVGGIVREIEPGSAVSRGLRPYRLELVPTLWLLSLGREVRIFQEQTALEIIEAVFKEQGLTDYDVAGVQTKPPVRTYCVQYREDHLAFVSRLMEEEGIFYFFDFQKTRHVLKLADSTAAYVKAKAKVPFRPDGAGSGVTSWSPGYSSRSGKWTLRDFDFEQPAAVTAETKTVIREPAFGAEVYDYPGGFTKKARGGTLSAALIEAHEAKHAVVSGSATLPGFAPGLSFTLTEHPAKDQAEKSFVITSVSHNAVDHTGLVGMDGAEDYGNSFTCIPAERTARPGRLTPRPVVAGPHTATVVGPKGEEIHCDKHGRVKVQFHWDRVGKNDEKSSCWIRVAQSLAGRSWGTVMIPRVGMEVVVDFLEGDPDRPLIVGCVYNGTNTPPYALPANKTQSGFKSQSTPNAGKADFNELRFEDKKGKEHVYFHAQKDFERKVEFSDTLTVQKSDRKVLLEEGSETFTIKKGDQSLTLNKGSRTIKLDKGDQSTTLGQGDFTLKLSSGSATVEAATKITLKVGSNKLVIDQQGITLQATKITLKASTMLNMTAGATAKLAATAPLTLKGAVVKIN